MKSTRIIAVVSTLIVGSGSVMRAFGILSIAAPFLFISGSEDHLMPPAVQRSNAKRYKSNAVTEIREFPGRSHLMPAQQGWEEIADYALAWAEEHATHRPPAAPTSS